MGKIGAKKTSFHPHASIKQMNSPALCCRQGLVDGLNLPADNAEPARDGGVFLWRVAISGGARFFAGCRADRFQWATLGGRIGARF